MGRRQLDRGRVAEMPSDIRARAEQALLFRAPERQPDGAPRTRADRLQNAHDLHHRGHARRVVGRAGCRMGGVEVRADHHHLIREVGARQLGDQVEPVQRLVGIAFRVEQGLDVQLHPHRDLLLQNADHAVVVLDGEGDSGNGGAGVLVSRPAPADEDGAAVGALRPGGETAAGGHHERVAAPIEHRDHPFLQVELLEQVGKRGAAATDARGRRGRHQGAGRLGELRVAHPQHDVAFEHLHVARRLGQDDLAAQGAAVGVEVVRGADVDPHHLGRHGAAGARRPGLGVPDDRHHLRLDHVGVEPHQRPAAAEREPLFVDVRQPPGPQPICRPGAGLFDGGRAADARTVDVTQPTDVVHRLRPGEPLGPDGVQGGPQGARIRRLGGRGGGDREQQGAGRGQHASSPWQEPRCIRTALRSQISQFAPCPA